MQEPISPSPPLFKPTTMYDPPLRQSEREKERERGGEIYVIRVLIYCASKKDEGGGGCRHNGVKWREETMREGN